MMMTLKKVILQKFDLSLRKFITGVNDEEITNRVPEVDTSLYGTNRWKWKPNYKLHVQSHKRSCKSMPKRYSNLYNKSYIMKEQCQVMQKK